MSEKSNWQCLPGWGVMAALAFASQWLSAELSFGEVQVPSTALAIVIAVGLATVWRPSELIRAGVRGFEQPLVLGVVLLGASLDFKLFVANGLLILGMVAATVLVGYLVISRLCRMAGLSKNLSVLLAAGTSICGGAAIGITAPLIKAKEDETSYALGTITICGFAVMLLYPALASLLQLDPYLFGYFAGTSVHATPQVVAAGNIYGEVSGNVATAVKLLRNSYMLPMAMLIAFWHWRGSAAEGERVSFASISKAFPWFLFMFFVMAGCNSLGYFTVNGVAAITKVGKFLLLTGMVGIGLNTDLGQIRRLGIKPLLIGFMSSAVLGGIAAVVVWACFG